MGTDGPLPRAQTLALLDRLVGQGRARRLTTLLTRHPWLHVDDSSGQKLGSVAYDPAWAMCVPECFREALDIQLVRRVRDKRPYLVWTQGSRFDFRAGYTIYDTPRAHAYLWLHARPHVRLSLRVREAAPAVPASGAIRRDPGRALLAVTVWPRDGGQPSFPHYVTTTQDELVRALIGGLPEPWLTREAADGAL